MTLQPLQNILIWTSVLVKSKFCACQNDLILIKIVDVSKIYNFHFSHNSCNIAKSVHSSFQTIIVGYIMYLI